MFADRIKTPLLLMCGEQDHNAPPRQLMEMYYALRHLNKEVEWVSYTNGGYGMPTTTVDGAVSTSAWSSGFSLVFDRRNS